MIAPSGLHRLSVEPSPYICYGTTRNAVKNAVVDALPRVSAGALSRNFRPGDTLQTVAVGINNVEDIEEGGRSRIACCREEAFDAVRGMCIKAPHQGKVFASGRGSNATRKAVGDICGSASEGLKRKGRLCRGDGWCRRGLRIRLEPGVVSGLLCRLTSRQK